MHRNALGAIAVVAALSAAPACRRSPPSSATAVLPGTRGPLDAGAGATGDTPATRFALVIGANVGSGVRKPLRYAEHDASRLSAVLRELGSFRNPELLLAPTAARVRSGLADLRARVQTARRDHPGARAVALVYYSGHSNGRSLELGRERVDFEEVQQTLIDSGADMRMLVVDACQSGTLLALKGGSPKPGFDLKAGQGSTGEAILTSAAESEDALESSELQASFFSHHLLSGLRGAADGNRDGRVTLSEAYHYASSRTVAETTATIYGAQHPTYRLRLSGQGDLALTELPGSRASVEVTGDLDRVLFIDALQGAVSEWAGGAARRLSLTAGPYLIKAWKGGRVLTGRMTLGLGEHRRLAPEMLEDPAAVVGPPAALPSPAAAVPEALLRRTVAGDERCRFRCVLDPANERSNCSSPVSVLAYEKPRTAVVIELPSRRSLLRLRFEVCDPKGMWLHVSDSPSGNGGGGDATQFSNDAELELVSSGLWLFGNDYGRSVDKVVPILASRADFVASTGCSVRTLVLGDGSLRSAEPAIDVRSPYALRLDPPNDHEGQPDRRWYLGLNRSVGSAAPGRVGSGLGWVELCVL